MKLADLLVGVFLGAIILYVFMPKPDPIVTPPQIVTDTTYVPVEVKVIKDSLITKFVPDTTDRGKLKKAYALVDSLIAQLDRDGNYGSGYGGTYSAYIDTTIMYGKDTAFYALTEVYQGIPFSDDAYAIMTVKYNIPIVNTLATYEPVYKENFWDKFGISLQTGVGYGWINKQIDFYTGLGVHYKLK